MEVKDRDQLEKNLEVVYQKSIAAAVLKQGEPLRPLSHSGAQSHHQTGRNGGFSHEKHAWSQHHPILW